MLDNEVPEAELGKELSVGNDGKEAIEEYVDDEERGSEPEGGMVMVPFA